MVSGCGSDGSNGSNGADGGNCMVEQLADGIYISCPDSDVFIPTPVDEDDTSEDSDDDSSSSDDSDDIVKCKRGKGHKKHDYTKHEPCDD